MLRTLSNDHHEPFLCCHLVHIHKAVKHSLRCAQVRTCGPTLSLIARRGGLSTSKTIKGHFVGHDVGSSVTPSFHHSMICVVLVDLRHCRNNCPSQPGSQAARQPGSQATNHPTIHPPIHASIHPSVHPSIHPSTQPTNQLRQHCRRLSPTFQTPRRRPCP